MNSDMNSQTVKNTLSQNKKFPQIIKITHMKATPNKNTVNAFMMYIIDPHITLSPQESLEHYLRDSLQFWYVLHPAIFRQNL